MIDELIEKYESQLKAVLAFLEEDKSNGSTAAKAKTTRLKTKIETYKTIILDLKKMKNSPEENVKINPESIIYPTAQEIHQIAMDYTLGTFSEVEGEISIELFRMLTHSFRDGMMNGFFDVLDQLSFPRELPETE